MNKILGIVVAFVIIAVGFVALAIERVPAGYMGVVYSVNGGVKGEPLGQGWHILAPTKKVVNYPISTESLYLSKEIIDDSEKDDSFNISSKDGKTVNVDAELSYRYDGERLNDVYKKFRGRKADDIANTFIRARLKDVANRVSSQYGVLDIYGEKRSELNNKVFEDLSKVLDANGIVLETFAFTRIEPDEETKKAINERVNAQQKLEQMKTEKSQAEVQAQKKIIEAQAQADAEIIRATGQAEANRVLNESLTTTLIEYEKTQKWDGKMPLSTNGTSIIDMRGME